MTKELPSYVLIDDAECQNRDILRKVADPFQFPLSEDDKEILKTLEAKFDSETNMTGLAAPQIGFSKQAIIFAVCDTPEMKKWRPDISDTLPKSIWLNPSYMPISDEKHSDYEGCFSVGEWAGEVERFKEVNYTAYLPNGEYIEGSASGFLARAIQHEIDHLNGILFIDLVPKDKLFTIEEYRHKRAERLKAASS
jgi:peptide deformylase